MPQPVRRVLIVGGGTAGSVLTLALRRQGIDVVLAERQTEWKAIGHGLTIQGNALRALREVGVADEVVAAGAPFDRLRMRTVDGELIKELVTPPLGGDALPPTMGSMRFLLQQILSRRVHASGADVRLGTSVEAIDDDGSDAGVAFTLSDGTTDRYDLVVGADGVHSTVRRLIGIEDGPKPIGMAIWRMEGPRQPGMDVAELYYGGSRYELVGEGHGVDKVLDLFMERRADRAALVVNNSVQLARWEIAPDTPGADPAGLMASSMATLAGS